MTALFRQGLTVPLAGPALPPGSAVETVLTDEAALTAPQGIDFRVEALATEGDMVAQGAPILQSRRDPRIVLTAPMTGRVARIELGPGRRLSRLVIFREGDAADRHRYQPGDLRALLLQSGLWTAFRSRPYGGFPAPDETPSAIFIMALDTRPFAPDPRLALKDREEDFARGLAALERLTDGPLHLVQDRGPDLARPSLRLHLRRAGPLHPQGLAGGHIHHLHPAHASRRIWDIAAEDVAGIGALLASGHVPQTRLVSVAGPALRAARLVRCQPGADLRALAHGLITPGHRMILSGSAIDGREAQFLAHRDRQATVLPRRPKDPDPHWFRGALSRASRPVPLIPTAALERAMFPGLPVMPLLRALSSGDAETVERLGGLSLLEEDLSLADYVTAANPRLTDIFRALLNRMEAEP